MSRPFAFPAPHSVISRRGRHLLPAIRHRRMKVGSTKWNRVSPDRDVHRREEQGTTFLDTNCRRSRPLPTATSITSRFDFEIDGRPGVSGGGSLDGGGS